MNTYLDRAARLCIAGTILVGICGHVSAADESRWRIGLGRADITPREPVLLSGYGSRDKPFERVDIPLSAKCMAIEDAHGSLAILITLDMECMYPHTAQPLWERLEGETGLVREQMLICYSHSHSAPFLSLNPETTAYGSTPETAKKTVAHTRWLFDQIVSAVKQAMSDRQPARLFWGTAVAPFVMNRRAFSGTDVKIGVNPRGYVDRSVPVLRVDSLAGRSRAVVLGCACHNATVGGKSFAVSGDFAGHAQRYVETEHPGVQAMFVTGCGADANPYPRGTLELARLHGRTLGEAVGDFMRPTESTKEPGGATSGVRASDMKMVSGPLVTVYDRISLPLRVVPSVKEMEAERDGDDYWHAYHAKLMLTRLETGKPVPSEYECPLSLWQFGRDLTLVGFPSEVVAGYVPLVETAIGRDGLWVAAYSNVMFGYLPTQKVIAEGGYENRGLEDGDVGQFAPEAEPRLIGSVREMAERARQMVSDAGESRPEL